MGENQQSFGMDQDILKQLGFLETGKDILKEGLGLLGDLAKNDDDDKKWYHIDAPIEDKGCLNCSKV